MLRTGNASAGGSRQYVAIADRAVARLHLRALRNTLDRELLVLTFAPGEASKSLRTASRFYGRLADARIERGAVIIAFGGGVAGDLAGFVAATWQRGVRFVQVPTTLLAAVDASVGGKTAVNLPQGKNLVGAFHQPEMVVVDTNFLQTLPDREFRSGLAESVKQALIRDRAFLEWHMSSVEAIGHRDPAAVTTLIARNCTIKAAVVARDERESGLRAILNYGHTLGHAIEHLLGYELRHGECVALGIVAENEIAFGRGLLARTLADEIRALLERLGLPTRLPRALDPSDVFTACSRDKKVAGGAVNFILLREPGATVRVADVTTAEVATALRAVQPS
ncbi:MAG TPA: 3-dehydroquinate synthase [Phycisphaerae bacterium]|nr:3-dehydroquinate synthase [Phycisphaerae bacterium]